MDWCRAGAGRDRVYAAAESGALGKARLEVAGPRTERGGRKKLAAIKGLLAGSSRLELQVDDLQLPAVRVEAEPQLKSFMIDGEISRAGEEGVAKL